MSGVFVGCEDSRPARDRAHGWERGSSAVRKGASGQTTEVLCASLWGLDCILWPWGVSGAATVEVLFRSCGERGRMVRGRPESPGRAQRGDVGRTLKMPLLGFRSSPGLPSHLGFTKGTPISHDEF